MTGGPGAALRARAVSAGVALVIGTTRMLCAQQPTAVHVTDSIHLGSLQRAAARRDPRAAQAALHTARARLRDRDLDAERLPSLELGGQAQHQSDVTRLAVPLPGVSIPSPVRDMYEAHVEARQTLLDPTRDARHRLGDAQLALTEAELASTLYGALDQVNEAYFQAVELAAHAAEIALAMTGLDVQIEQARNRVRAGTALPSDTAMLQAELLRRRVEREALLADHRAALARLADLTGVRLSDSAALALPDVDQAMHAAGSDAEAVGVRRRPEFAALARRRELIGARADLTASATRPRIDAFARAGYGRPGLNMLNRDAESFWLAGLRAHWAPFTWGTHEREREAIALEQEVVRAEESALAAQLARATARDVARMTQLERALGLDERIVTLREQVERETRLRFGQGVVTAAEYVGRRTDVLQARLTRTTHQLQLARARVNYLTTLGIPLP